MRATPLLYYLCNISIQMKLNQQVVNIYNAKTGKIVKITDEFTPSGQRVFYVDYGFYGISWETEDVVSLEQPIKTQ